MKKMVQHQDGTARAHVKACTDSAHKRLHGVPQFDALLRGTLSLEDYADLMAVLSAFYQELDAVAASACQIYLNPAIPYRYRPRSPLIGADVAAVRDRLGRHSASSQAEFLRPDLPAIGSGAALAGLVYVVDGATLGGRLLNKSAARLLGAEDARGRSYWRWCDTHGAAQWKAALALIDRYGQEQSGRHEMAETALATFEALERQFALHAPQDWAGAA